MLALGASARKEAPAKRPWRSASPWRFSSPAVSLWWSILTRKGRRPSGAIYGKADQPVVVSAHAPRIGRVLDAARARGVGLVVIDTAPHASDAALAAARCHTHDRVVAHAHFQQPAPQSRRLVCRFWPIRSGSATMRPGRRRSARGGRAGGGPGGRAPRRRTC